MIDLRSADGGSSDVPPSLVSCTCEHCREHAAAPDDDTSPLIVEDRIRVALDCLVSVGRITRLAEQPTGIPVFSDLRRVARFIRQVTRAVERHLLAVKAALPVSATNLAAPDWKEGA